MHTTASHLPQPLIGTMPSMQAAFLVIGDEILRGSVADANTPWLAKLLHAQGVDLIRVLCVPDNIDNIVEALHDLRSRVGADGFIFTSGGIGATHDDVTYAAVARAYELPLERHPPTVDLMQQHYSARGLELNEARLRMATIPTPSGDARLRSPRTAPTPARRQGEPARGRFCMHCFSQLLSPLLRRVQRC